MYSPAYGAAVEAVKSRSRYRIPDCLLVRLRRSLPIALSSMSLAPILHPFQRESMVGLRHGKQSYGSRSSLHVADGYYLRVHRYRCIRSVAWPLQRPEVVFPHRAEASPTQGFRRSYGSYRLANDGVNPHPVPSGWGVFFMLPAVPFTLQTAALPRAVSERTGYRCTHGY